MSDKIKLSVIVSAEMVIDRSAYPDGYTNEQIKESELEFVQEWILDVSTTNVDLTVTDVE